MNKETTNLDDMVTKGLYYESYCYVCDKVDLIFLLKINRHAFRSLKMMVYIYIFLRNLVQNYVKFSSTEQNLT